MALLPGLGVQILEEMDVEGVTEVLQGRSLQREDTGSSSRDPSVSSNNSQSSPGNANTPTLPTLRSEGQQPSHEAEANRSSGGSEAWNDEPSAAGKMEESSLSWVEQFTTASSNSNGARSPSVAEAQLSDSIISGSLSNTSEVVRHNIFYAMRLSHMFPAAVGFESCILRS